MFEQTFKNIDDILHKDAGCGSELDYVEQTSWVLFLKYLDDLEKDKQTAAELSGKSYSKIIDEEFQWSHWAAPKLENGKMALNKIGEIAKTEWLKTFEMRPDMNLKIDEFVVMPNHFHAILIIGENKYNTQSDGNRHRRDAMHCVSTTETTTDMKKNKFGAQSKNLASTIRGFKIGVTKNARQINPAFAWQPRFYDRVIRDESELNRIRKYIINHSQNWQKDANYISEMMK